MSRIELRRSITTSLSPETIFETLCDLERASMWLPNCLGIELVDDAPVAVGSPLLYRYKEMGYEGMLTCSVATFIPGQHLAIAFSDPRAEASFEFVLLHQGASTTIDHGVKLVPRSLAVRLVSGMIARRLPGRMDAALRGLVRAAGAS